MFSFLILAQTWRNKEAWGKNIKQDLQASKNILRWRFMTCAMAQVKAWGGSYKSNCNFLSFSFTLWSSPPSRKEPTTFSVSGVTSQVCTGAPGEQWGTARFGRTRALLGESLGRASPEGPVCSPESFLNLLVFCSYCTFFVFFYSPQTFPLWSYLRLSSKGSVPFLSINLHIKEITPCSASVFGVNAKKTPLS